MIPLIGVCHANGHTRGTPESPIRFRVYAGAPPRRAGHELSRGPPQSQFRPGQFINAVSADASPEAPGTRHGHSRDGQLGTTAFGRLGESAGQAGQPGSTRTTAASRGRTGLSVGLPPSTGWLGGSWCGPLRWFFSTRESRGLPDGKVGPGQDPIRRGADLRPAPPVQTPRRPLGTPNRTPRRLRLIGLRPHLLEATEEAPIMTVSRAFGYNSHHSPGGLAAHVWVKSCTGPTPDRYPGQSRP